MPANTNYSEIIATTIENRSKKIADNVTNHNALLKKMEMGGRTKTFSGGHKILQELSYAENPNLGWYSGYDVLPVAAGDVISAAEFDIKQAAVPVVMSGLEMLQNNGKEQMIDLMEARLQVAESSMANLLSEGIYSDGTGYGGKQIDGLDACAENVLTASQTSTYGNISRTTWPFWRSVYHTNTTAGGGALASSNVNDAFTYTWSLLTRGVDRPDLIICDNLYWRAYMGALQDIQRFTTADSAKFGFASVKFMDADVVLDGGMHFSASTGTGVDTGQVYFLNTKYLFWRPHAQRNMVPLSPNKRYAVNQDAEVQILAWAGNLTCSGAAFQGRMDDA